MLSLLLKQLRRIEAGLAILILCAIVVIVFIGAVGRYSGNPALWSDEAALAPPSLVAVGFDPVHVGVVMIILVTMGGDTPPIGVIMYTVCGVVKCDFMDFVKWSGPFLLAMFLLISALALFPPLVL